MSKRSAGNSWIYVLIVLLAFAAVALWRLDLFLGAWHATKATYLVGGGARWRLVGEVLLFSAILLATVSTLSASVQPAHDIAIVLFAAILGWTVEAWGTRLGLWRYYTGERPPLWIVPVWPLGAAMVDRISSKFRAEFGPAPEPFYWLLGAIALGISLRVCAPWLDHPAAWAIPLLVLVSLLSSSNPSEDFWLLAAGMAAVFFADLWGVTNGCWSYDLRGRPGGVGWGIAFGMSFDAATILICLRLARGVR